MNVEKYVYDKEQVERERIKEVMRSARIKIENELDYVDIKPYSHNIISVVLQMVAKDCGTKYADELIDVYALEDLGWEKP